MLFPSGITLSKMELDCLKHVEADPETWLLETLATYVQYRRDALIREWEPVLLADPAVRRIPKNPDTVARLIMARPDFKTRAQQDEEQEEPLYLYNTRKYEEKERGRDTVALCPGGIAITNQHAAYILAHVQDISDFIIGAVMGSVHRGKVKMMRQYQPALVADPNTDDLPATEAEQVALIVARPEYRTLPQQVAGRP